MLFMSRKVSRVLVVSLCCAVVCLSGWLLTVSFTSKQANVWQYSSKDVTFDKELWKTPVVFDELPQEEAQRRVHRSISDVCKDTNNLYHKNLNTLDRYYLHYLLVDEEHKFMYCYVPKVSCTLWKQIVLELGGVNLKNFSHDDIHDYKFKRLKDYSDSQRETMLRTYKKFMFIREPFERVVSAFRDKFEKNNTFYRRHVATHIIKQHRQNPSEEALKKGDDLTFAEFIKSIAEKNPKMDEHWIPGTILCQPCIINYDIIGYQESLKRDASVVLRYLGVDNKVKFPNIKTAKTGDKLRKYFQNIPYCHLQGVLKVFEADFKAFGYAIPTSLRDMFYKEDVC